MIILDSNVLIWISRGDRALGRGAMRLVDREAGRGGAAYSAISIWEVAVAVRKQKVRLEGSILDWRRALQDNKLSEIALDGVIAARAEDFVGLHGDPGDRFIAATADCNEAKLVTSDAALLRWAGSRGVDARI